VLLLVCTAAAAAAAAHTNREPEIVLSRGVAMDRKFLQDHSLKQWLGLLFMVLCDLATLLLATSLFLTPLELMVSSTLYMYTATAVDVVYMSRPVVDRTCMCSSVAYTD
jgi:hypothetical protein